MRHAEHLPVPPDLATALLLARRASEALLDDLPMLRNEVGESDEVGGYILDRVAVAADHATGCAMLGEARLAAPCAVVTRSLLEGFFGTYWASLDDSKGRQLMEATKKELLRITRINLTNGHATIRDRVTGEDRTQELLRHPAMAKAERLLAFAAYWKWKPGRPPETSSSP